MMNAEVFHRFVREKEFDQARELLYRMSNENGYFSYSSATELIESLPREWSQDRIAIFSRALEAYGQHTDEKYPSVDDPAIMLLQVWESLPPSLVLSAIDQIFDRAKDVDEDRANDVDNQQQDFRVGISTSKGGAYFSSVYQFRLFQLMPILEQLDKSQAESLLSQNGDVQAALEHYPQGVGSMNASSNGKTQSSGRFMTGIVSIGAQDAVHAGADENVSEIVRRQQLILNEAETDPQQALSDAMRLPLDTENNFRASTLKSVARISAMKDPAVSRAALDEVRKVAKNLPAHNQAQILAEVPEIYLRLHDETEARSSLSELTKVARKLYDQDSDSDDPNEAFKGMWPSANLWRHCVAVAAKLTPSPAEGIVTEIPDPEIKTFERVALANSLLGADFVSLSTLEKHKNGMRASMGF
ncbi:MAG TPA: hypothetical protein VJX30_07470 [Terriglobales bacterium]|nr:hypothetical protein [Terriglobales bacterium]